MTKREHKFSSVGKTDGISGCVDLNVPYVDYPDSHEKEQHEKNDVIPLNKLAAEPVARGESSITHIGLEG